MKQLLIPFFWLGTMLTAFAQVPENFSVSSPVKPDLSLQFQAGDALPCNFAGTMTFVPQMGQSNDVDLDTIYLCFGDSIFIDHNGDFDLTGSPNPATDPGIAYVFYDCPPTIAGDNLQAILGDPCLTNSPPPMNGAWFARGTIDGDVMFRNTGAIQNTFNLGQSHILHFAPITVDYWDSLRFESTQPGFPPGPCVNANVAAQFAVAYLNEIEESGVNNMYQGDDCLGIFRVTGGLPNLFNTSTYDINISLASNPEVQALLLLPPSQLQDGANVGFSVSQPGIYNVTVNDDKSCGHTFQVDMSGCDPSDNTTFIFPDTVAPPGSSICIPVTVENFIDILTANINVSWDPAIFQYTGVQNPNPNIGTFDSGNLNEINTALGLLGINVFNQDIFGQTITIPDGETLVEICFDVIGSLNQCSPLTIPSGPGAVSVEDEMGMNLGITIDTGQICVDFLPLDLAVSLQDTMCMGTSNSAALVVQAIGGMEPFEVTWQEIPGGPVNNGFIPNAGGTFISQPDAITSGTWVISIIDENGVGVTVRDTIVVDFPTLGASLNLTQTPSCFGSDDGQVSANVLVNGSIVPSDTSQYTFTWSGPNVVQGIPVQDSLSVGVYAVTITDRATGCTAIASGTLGQPLILQDDDIQRTLPTCSGLPDGSVTYTMQGGTPFPGGLYTFNWTYSPDGISGPFQDDAGQSNPFFLSNKQAGIYFLTVTDANGCTFTDSIQLEPLRDIDLTGIVTNTSCAGINDGMIDVQVTVTPSDPNDNFSFFFAPAGFPQNCTPLSCNYSNLPQGTYNVVAIDALGCVDTANFTVMSPPPLVLDTLGFNQPSCALQNNGTITVIALGGTGGPMTFQYMWDDGTMGPNRSMLVPGMYDVTVTDLNGCQDSLEFDLQLPAPPDILSIDSMSVLCGSDGSLTVNADTNAVLFTWQTLGGMFLADSSTVNDLPGGTYVVVVSDDRGCENFDTVSLAGVDTLLFIDTTFLLPSCFGDADGRIGVTVSGGTGGYNYLWDPTGQTTATVIDIASGTYTVEVTDANNCLLTGTFELLDPPAITATYAQVPTTCADTCDGQATPTVLYSDGTTGDFNFIWCDGSQDSVRLDLCPGLCAVTISDGNNCFLLDTVFTDSPDSISFTTFTADPASCFGLSDGVVSIDGAGGDGGPYSYLWSVNNATTPTVTNLPAGDYTVTVTDGTGCTAEFTAFITEPSEIVVTQDLVNTVLPICFGDSNGQLAVNATGGNAGAYTYAWTDSMGITGTNAVLENIPAGEYFVTVTDALGCTGTLLNLVLNDPPPIVGSILPWMELTCNGDETTLFIDNITGGSGAPYQYSLDFGVLLDPSFPISMDGGQHFVTYYDRLNCSITDTIFVFEPDPLEVVFTPDEIEIELGDTLTILQPNITGALVDTFIWEPADLLTNPFTLNPMVNTFTSTTYTLTVFDANGCFGEGSIRIEVDPNRNVYIPNIFHPGNTSGLNDHFNIYVGLGIEIVNSFQIFDRWGGLVYERTDFFPNSFDFGEGWDGRYNGDFVNPGVFVYVAEIKFLDGRVLTYRGDVTVIR